MSKSLVLWIFSIGIFTEVFGITPVVLGGPSSQNFTITTLNIRWYGNGKKKNKSRDKQLSQFIQEKLAASDGILLQEIVDVDGLQKNVMGENFECYNYFHRNRGHQSVVLCLKKKFKFVREVDDDNWQVDEVSYGSDGARPALSGVIRNEEGLGLFHLLGVHLKAFPKKTGVRLDQTESIAERIETYPDQLPVVLLGDFNSHIKEKTRRSRDDKYLMLDILSSVGMDLVDLDGRNTWTSKSKQAQLDQIYISDDLEMVGEPKVDGPCNLNQSAGPSKQKIQAYLSNISDHCPVTISLKL